MTHDLDLEAKILRAVARAMEPYEQHVTELRDDAARVARYAEEDRRRLALTVKEDSERQATEVAEKVVAQMMRALGLDPDKPSDFVRDMLFLRELRETFSAARKHTILAVIGLAVLGIATAVWHMVKSGAVKP